MKALEIHAISVTLMYPCVSIQDFPQNPYDCQNGETNYFFYALEAHKNYIGSKIIIGTPHMLGRIKYPLSCTWKTSSKTKSVHIWI